MNKLKAEKIIGTLIQKINCNRKVAEKILVAHIHMGFNFDIIKVVENLFPNREVNLKSRECSCGREDCEVSWIEVDGVNISDLVWDIVNEKEITPLTPKEFVEKKK